MIKASLFILALAFTPGAYAAELNGYCAADVKTAFTSEVPAPSFSKAYTPKSAPTVCEAALAKSIGFRETVFRDLKDQPLRGFEKGYYTERGPMQMALVLQTAREAFYYYEDCDICAEVDKCDLKTGAVKRIVVAHSAGCADIAPFAAGAVYNSCASAGPACSPIGGAVRIPEECCSQHAEPAYGGEMVCVEAPHPGYTCAAVGDAVRIPEECCSLNAEPAYGGEMVCVEARK
ncbi:MAG TPA: hypothetical protein PKI19_04110 [Elusimicrobiales bacterium]|nr:hypothetical protein [Elusimicrobiales bacterium]